MWQNIFFINYDKTWIMTNLNLWEENQFKKGLLLRKFDTWTPYITISFFWLKNGGGVSGGGWGGWVLSLVVKEGWPMRGLELIMWSEAQWEASKKVTWKGDRKQKDGHRDYLTNSAQRAVLVKTYLSQRARKLWRSLKDKQINR